MKVLVTGGSGLVGTALKNEALVENSKTWCFLSSKDGDLRNIEECKAIFEKHKPDVVIHLAAKVGGLFKNMRAEAEMLSDNLHINLNVIECSRIFKVKKVISCLSTCIFPDETPYPIDEKMIHKGPPHDSNFGYAYAKRLIDIQNRAYHDQFGCKYTSIVPTNIYGPFDNFNLQDGHVIPVLIRKIYEAKQKSTPDIVLMGTGRALRQFIFAPDLAKLILWTIDFYNEIEPIILCPDSEDEVTISTLSNIIKNSLGYEGSIKFDNVSADGQYRKTASNKKLRQYLPEFQFTPLHEGIGKTTHWFQENYQKVRE